MTCGLVPSAYVPGSRVVPLVIGVRSRGYAFGYTAGHNIAPFSGFLMFCCVGGGSEVVTPLLKDRGADLRSATTF